MKDLAQARSFAVAQQKIEILAFSNILLISTLAPVPLVPFRPSYLTFVPGDKRKAAKGTAFLTTWTPGIEGGMGMFPSRGSTDQRAIEQSVPTKAPSMPPFGKRPKGVTGRPPLHRQGIQICGWPNAARAARCGRATSCFRISDTSAAPQWRLILPATTEFEPYAN